jgi:hypothetical protein
MVFSIRFSTRGKISPSYNIQDADEPWNPLSLILCVAGASSPVLKRLRCKADHSPSFSIKVSNVWSYTSTPSYVFIPLCLTNHNNNHSTSHLFLGPLCGFFLSSFLTNFVHISSLPKLATCWTNHTLLDLVSDEGYKL